MEQFLGKKYKLKSSENFEEYLKYIDVGFISRKTALAVTTTAILTQNEDGSYTYTVLNTFKNSIVTFKLGEEFIEERLDGVKVKSIVTIEGNKLIQIQIEDNGRKSVHVREYTDDLLTVTSTAEGWDGKCVRIYELVQ